MEGIKKRLDELNLLKQSLFDYFGAEDVQNVDLYKTVNTQIANLSASYEEYTTSLSDYNNTAAEAQIVQSLVGKEIPKTVEEYKKYRSELIKSANDSNEYIGSQEDIINSIDGTLSKMSEFADVQNRLNNIETAKNKFVIGKVNSKPISDFIDALSDEDLSILIQLDTNVFDKGIENVSQAIEDFKSNPDNQISVDVDTSEADTSSLEKLQEAYDNLSKSAESYTKVQKTLTDAIKQQEEYGQLSADTIQSLTDAGYAQALSVNTETGAVTLNTEAYNRLNEQKKQKLKLDLEQQNTDLQTKIKEEESTISSLKKEYEALAKANAEANAERLKEIEIELTAHSQDEARLRELVDKNNAAKIGLDAPTFEKSDNKDSWKEEAEKKFADLEHLYAMDKISYASYLNQMDKLNQHYYGNNEKYLDSFYKYEEKIYQGRKKLAEDLLAEEEKTQKAYHDKRISELEEKITVTTNDSVDDQGNKLNASEKFDYENEFTGNINKAISYANRALSFCDAAENPVLAANLNMNLGNLYVRKNELDNAKKYMETAMEIMAYVNVPTADVIIMTRNYADLLYMLGEKNRALNALTKCAELAKNVDHSEYAALLYDAAVINADIKNISEAVRLFNLSFKAYAKMGAYEELQEKQAKAAYLLSSMKFTVPQN